MHPASLKLSEARGNGAVLYLPFINENGQFYGDIFFQQTIHGRAIPFRLEGRQEEVIASALLGNRFYRELESAQRGIKSAHPNYCAGVEDLSAMGFDAIVIRTDRLDRKTSEILVSAVERCMGKIEHVGTARIAWLKAE